MKKYILFTFLMFLVFSLSSVLSGCSVVKEKHLSDLDTIKERGYLIAGVKNDSPPFGYLDGETLKGIDIDIAKYIAQAIFNTDNPDRIQFVPVNPQNRIAKLNSKEVDIICATLSINPKRELVVDFSKPYWVANQKLMVKKDSKITSLQYFNSKGRLGVVMGTTGEKIIHLISPNAQVTGAKTYPDAIEALNYSYVDGIIGDDAILKGYENDDLRIINRSYSKEYYAVGVRKSQDSKDLLDTIDAAISQILDEKKLSAKQFALRPKMLISPSKTEASKQQKNGDDNTKNTNSANTKDSSASANTDPENTKGYNLDDNKTSIDINLFGADSANKKENDASLENAKNTKKSKVKIPKINKNNNKNNDNTEQNESAQEIEKILENASN